MLKIYEYISEDGDTYWSFTDLNQKVSKPMRLIMHRRLGIPVIAFFRRIQNFAKYLIDSEEE